MVLDHRYFLFCVLQIHWPTFVDLANPAGFVAELKRLQAKGLIRHYGLCNFGPQNMKDILAAGAQPITNQVETVLIEKKYQKLYRCAPVEKPQALHSKCGLLHFASYSYPYEINMFIPKYGLSKVMISHKEGTYCILSYVMSSHAVVQNEGWSFNKETLDGVLEYQSDDSNGEVLGGGAICVCKSLTLWTYFTIIWNTPIAPKYSNNRQRYPSSLCIMIVTTGALQPAVEGRRVWHHPHVSAEQYRSADLFLPAAGPAYWQVQKAGGCTGGQAQVSTLQCLQVEKLLSLRWTDKSKIHLKVLSQKGWSHYKGDLWVVLGFGRMTPPTILARCSPKKEWNTE